MLSYRSLFVDTGTAYQNTTAGTSSASSSGGVQGTSAGTTGLNYTSRFTRSTVATSTVEFLHSTSSNSTGGTTYSRTLHTNTIGSAQTTASTSASRATLTYASYTGTSAGTATRIATVTSTVTSFQVAYSADSNGSSQITVSTTRAQSKTAGTETTTFSALASTTSSRLDLPTLENTVYRFVVTAPDVLWLPTVTGVTTDKLSNLAVSITANTTLFATDYLSSFSSTLSTSSGAFTTVSFGTTLNSHSSSYVDTGAPLSATAAAATARLFFIGTAPVAAATATYTSASASASFSQASTVYSGTAVGLQTFTRTTSRRSTAASTVYTTFTANDLADDAAYTFPNVAPRGLRTATVRVSTTGSVTMTSWSDSGTNTTSLTPSVAAGAFSFTRWSRDVIDLRTIANAQNTFYLASAATGFVAFGVAGEQPSFRRGLTASMDSQLAGYDLWIYESVSRALNYEASVIYRDPVTFTLSDAVIGEATAAFSTTSAATSDATLLVTLNTTYSTVNETGGTDSVPLTGRITFGFESAFALAAETGHRSAGVSYIGDNPVSFGGGRQNVNVSQTMRFGSGGRNMTTVDSSGGSSTASTFRGSFDSKTLATSALVFESSLSLYAAQRTSAAAGSTALTLPLYQTVASSHLAPPKPNLW